MKTGQALLDRYSVLYVFYDALRYIFQMKMLVLLLLSLLSVPSLTLKVDIERNLYNIDAILRVNLFLLSGWTYYGEFGPIFRMNFLSL